MFAALLLVITTGVAILLIQNYQLRSNNEQLQTQLRQSEAEKAGVQQKAQALQQQIEANSARYSQLLEELKREQQQGNEQAQRPARLPAPLPSLASLVLTPAARRFATPDTLVLRPATKSVLLTIPIEGDSKSKQ